MGMHNYKPIIEQHMKKIQQALCDIFLKIMGVVIFDLFFLRCVQYEKNPAGALRYIVRKLEYLVIYIM